VELPAQAASNEELVVSPEVSGRLLPGVYKFTVNNRAG
jgi:hypothetical protein